LLIHASKSGSCASGRNDQLPNLLDPMAFTPAPSASKSFGSEVTAAYFTRFGDHIAWRTSSARHTAGHGSPAEWSIQTHFNHGKIASCSGFGKSLMWGWGQQMVLAGSCSLQRHAAGSARAYGTPLVEARLRSAGDNQGKLPCSQHHTGSAEKPVGYSPFCCF
jgi:hypothetical protein